MLSPLGSTPPLVSSISLAPPALQSTVSHLAQQVLTAEKLFPSSSGSAGAVVWLKYASFVGVFASIVAIISGLAINLLGVAGMGILFAITSGVGVYSAYLLASLKDVDTYSRELFVLNQSLQKKNAEIALLSNRIAQTVQSLSVVEDKYEKLVKEDQAAQEALHTQLVSTEEKLRHAVEEFDEEQAEAVEALAKTTKEFEEQEGRLQKEIEGESAQILVLKKTIDDAKGENDRLNMEVAALKEAMEGYVRQNQEYAKQNVLLQQQIKSFGQLPSRPLPVDVAAVTSHAKTLQGLLIQQNSEADKVVQAVSQLKGIVDRIDAIKKERAT